MKKKYINYLTIFYVISFLLIGIITIGLFFQYKYFKKTSKELVELKDLYNQNIITLKRIIIDNIEKNFNKNITKNSLEQTEKKKSLLND